MRSLELAVPPPAVAMVVALVMWGISRVAPMLDMPAAARTGASVGLTLAGLAFGVAGVLAFRRVHTTVDPTRPDAASTLVRSGMYRITRNPMYVGLACVLAAWAVYLSSAWALLALPVFVLYISRFQIAPEERALSKRFGAEYAAYRARVRRWL